MAMAQHTGSYYAATAIAAPERPALKGQIGCDACVIGAGFTGLSTALHLAEKGQRWSEDESITDKLRAILRTVGTAR